MNAYYTAFLLFFIFSLFLIAYGIWIIKQDQEQEKKENLNKTKSH